MELEKIYTIDNLNKAKTELEYTHKDLAAITGTTEDNIKYVFRAKTKKLPAWARVVIYMWLHEKNAVKKERLKNKPA